MLQYFHTCFLISLLDESTCCDEDFTWVKSESNTPKVSPQKDPAKASKSNEMKTATPATSLNCNSSQNGNGKPPRPIGSLDRRRQLSTNREERDHKSRSAHSLKEKGSDAKDSRNKSKHTISRTGSFEVRHGSNSGESSFGPRSADYHRGSPGFWEPPPPPAFPYYWDGYHFWPSSCHASREELQGMDYGVMGAHRRPLGPPGTLQSHDQHHHHHQPRFGSSSTLSTSQQDLSCSPYCGRYMGPMTHSHGYCNGCESGVGSVGAIRSYPHQHHSTNSLWSQVGT